jgi:hypothetical protein
MRCSIRNWAIAMPVLLWTAVVAVGTAAGQEASDGSAPTLESHHPDLSGTWDNGSGIDFVQPQQQGESICVRGCEPAKSPSQATSSPPSRPTRPKYRPEFAARVADLADRQVEEDPVLRCFAPGVPRIGPPDKIVQRDNEVVFLYDDVSGSFFRIVPTDGRPRTVNEPSFLGDAVGHWEGDTLVVETVNFNGKAWLTDDGAFHTKDLRVVERLRRGADDTLEWRATAYDPAVLSEPWELQPRIAHLTDLEIVEAPPCIDRSLEHIVDGSHHTNPR